MTRLDPTHPGEMVKHDFIEPFRLSATSLARAIKVTPAHYGERQLPRAACRVKPSGRNNLSRRTTYLFVCIYGQNEISHASEFPHPSA
jgi:hypothetical protein